MQGAFLYDADAQDFEEAQEDVGELVDDFVDLLLFLFADEPGPLGSDDLVLEFAGAAAEEAISGTSSIQKLIIGAITEEVVFHFAGDVGIQVVTGSHTIIRIVHHFSLIFLRRALLMLPKIRKF